MLPISSNPSARPSASLTRSLIQTPLAAADIEDVSQVAAGLHLSAVDGVDPASPQAADHANIGRLVVARSLHGLVHDAMRQQAGSGVVDGLLPLKLVRSAKSAAICLRDMGLHGPAERELLAVAHQQAGLRDPDQSETWIILSNLRLSAQEPNGATQAALQAVLACQKDGWPARMRERMSELADSPFHEQGDEAASRTLFGQIGHWYPAPSDQMMGHALQQLENSVEARIDGLSGPQQVQTAIAQRQDVLQLSANLLGATHEGTLTRAAVFCNNNARLWMDVENWSAAAEQMQEAIHLGSLAQLGEDTLDFFMRRLATCQSHLDAAPSEQDDGGRSTI